MPPLLSVLIPLAPGENSWRDLISDLESVGTCAEILFVVTTEERAHLEDELAQLDLAPAVRTISAPPGRAAQLNAGASAAEGEFLLFLHADSRVSATAWAALLNSLDRHPDRLHYFNLRFQTDGPRWMPLNAWGVWFRSHWFKLPFGDQGLCLKAEQFRQIGPFDESVPYGEDHVFVWTARIHGMRLRCTGASIETSARKYRDHGWLRTTLRHLWLTIRQAVPNWWRLVRRRWGGRV
ncbi:MAG TPA: glycosyltransferase family 2 protein [Planctomycetaceae bacterium]|nr:glycosyltransferase family 2 protein [Planctomycetaceae bacterium]